MSLGKKTIALFSILGLSFCLGGYAVQQLTIFPAFQAFEEKFSRDTVERVMDALDAELRALEVMNVEYSLWDDTYEYALGQGAGYADDNLDPIYWTSLDIHLFLIFDAEGNRLFAYFTSPDDQTPFSLEEQLHEPLVAGHPLVSHESDAGPVKGFLKTRYGLMHVVSHAILKTDATGPVAGSLVMGQFLGDKRLLELGKRATAELAFLSPDDADLGDDFRTVSLDDRTTYVSYDQDVARGYRSIFDIHGAPAAVLEVRTPRTITEIGSRTIRTATTLLIAASTIFIVAAWLLSQLNIVRPIKRLTDKILHIQETGNLEFEADADRSDEVGVLAKEFTALTTKLKRVQMDLEESRDEALEVAKAKSEFLARMSHEIRTPMNGVLGMTELLRDTQLDGKQERIAETINVSATSLLHIINDILDFSKIEAGKLQLNNAEVDLRALVEETSEAFAGQAHRKGLELLNVVDPDLDVAVHVDPVRLRQVLTNLVGNAIKFTATGEVVIRLTPEENDAGALAVRFEVSDTGIGIRTGKQGDIFDPFTQEDGTTTRLYGGTGLGLAICKQIIDAMGGQLAVDSKPGDGSTFSFTLALKKGEQLDTVRTDQPRFVVGSRILVVDDNATNREILNHQLGRWRALPEVASSARQALSILESAVASGEPYDLAILDMHMPNMDGLQLARAIRRNPGLAALKLVILSSVADPASEDTLSELTIAGQLTKPIQQSQLYDALIAVLGGGTVVPSRQSPKFTTANALSGRVLLAEDNPVNQVVATGMLKNLGVGVEVAGDGEQAVAKALAGNFDAILMDCQMPVLDGFAATDSIRRAEEREGAARLPIIAVTANALKGHRERCLGAGMDEYLTKPFTKEQLHAILGPFLVKRKAANSGSTEPDLPQDELTGRHDSRSAIDGSVLAMLSELQDPDSPDIIQQVAQVYLESSRSLKEKLTAAIEKADASTVRENAHSLKSSSANIGANGLAEICRRLESLGQEGDFSGGDALRATLEREYERVVEALGEQFGAAAACDTKAKPGFALHGIPV